MEDLKYRYKKQMVVFSTKKYCRKLLELCNNPYENCDEVFFADSPGFSIDENNPVDKYLARVFDLYQAGSLLNHLSELEELSPFPSELKGYIHEYSTNGIFVKSKDKDGWHGEDKLFQPVHLMQKRNVYRDENHKITYEFLVEYGLLRSDVEIYYGVKAVSDFSSAVTTLSEYDKSEEYKEFVDYVQKLSRSWFEMISLTERKKDLTGILKKYTFHRSYLEKLKKLKFTNNAHDGTFWIAWGRMESIDKWSDVTSIFDNVLTSESIIKVQEYQEFRERESEDQALREHTKAERGTVSLDNLIKDIEQKHKRSRTIDHWLTTQQVPSLTKKEMMIFQRLFLKAPSNYNIGKVSIRNYIETLIVEACSSKNREDMTSSTTILTRTPKGTYQFNCTDDEIRYFIHKLYNPDEMTLAESIYLDKICRQGNSVNRRLKKELRSQMNEELEKDDNYKRLKKYHIHVNWDIIRSLFRKKEDQELGSNFETIPFNKIIENIPVLLSGESRMDLDENTGLPNIT